MFEPGSLVDKYRIVRKLGEGGMGAVFAAEHTLLGRLVAFKVLHPHIAQHGEIVQRFLNEARAAAKLKSRHVVGVHDVGQLPGGAYWIALEYLDGESLADFMQRQAGPLPLPMILRLLAEAGAGLAVAHEHGIVHRDVKPDNLFLERVDDPAAGHVLVRVLDFGIAKLGEHASGVKTRSSAVMGTPPYMAPEQLLDSSTVDPRSDVYALAAIAFELATLRRPWGDETRPNAIYNLQMTQPPPDPLLHRSDLPQPWVNVVRHGLVADARQRWASVRDFLQALAQATPATEWHTGVDLLRQFAPELITTTDDGRTVGHKLPSALAAPQSTPPEAAAAHTPATLSDGVPRATDAPGFAPAGPSTAPLASMPVAVTTLTSGAAQSVAPAPPARRSRAWIAIAAAGLAVGGGIAVLAGSGGEGAPSPPTTPRVVAVDAGPTMTVLPVVTDPAGAIVSIDGVSFGPSPVKASVQVGTTVHVRAELAGHDATEKTLRVEPTPGPLRLALVPVPFAPDAGVVAPDAAPERPAERPSGRPRPRPRPQGNATGSATGTASGTGSPRFNPDDVGGD